MQKPFRDEQALAPTSDEDSYQRPHDQDQELSRSESNDLGSPQNCGPVAYIMSRFPKLTETFILFEILAVEELGQPVEIFPLWREPAKTIHPEAQALVDRAHFHGTISWPIAMANLRTLVTHPITYLTTLLNTLWLTLGNARFFFAALAIFPKSVFFAEQMKQLGVRHVHAHFASHPACAAFIIQRIAGIPYSFTAHGSDLHRERRMLTEKVSASKFVVAVSEYNRRIIVDHCDGQFADKVHVIHCGVTLDKFGPAEDKETMSDEKKTTQNKTSSLFTIFCIGTLHEVKGQGYLIESCFQLHQQGVDVSLNFVGDGPDESKLRAMVDEKGIESLVTFHGRKNHHEIVTLLSTADCLAAPSVPTSDGRREGIPVVLMEAMASGLPVIASRLSGIPELVIDQENGLLVEPRSATDITQAVLKLSGNRELCSRLANEGRLKVARDFNQDINAQTLLHSFNQSEPQQGRVN